MLRRHNYRDLEELLRAMSAWFAGFISCLIIFYLFVELTNGLMYPSVLFYIALSVSLLSAPAMFIGLLKLQALQVKSKRILLTIGVSLYIVLFAVLVTLFIGGLNSLGNIHTRVI